MIEAWTSFMRSLSSPSEPASSCCSWGLAWRSDGVAAADREDCPTASARRPSRLGLVTTSLPTIARVASILCWIVISAVLLRIVSGGGSLDGVGYVLSTEPRIALAGGAALLLTAALVSEALIRDRPWAWRASRVGAAAALAGSLVLLVDRHSSGIIALAAAGLALAIAVVMMVRAGGESR